NFYIHNTLITGSFDLSENRNLKYVHTNNTGVSGINVDGLTSLVEFEATDCEQLVGEYDFTGNPLLEFVGVSNTKVSNINVQGLSKLAYLGVAKTQIEGVLDLRGCTSLQTLNAYEVQIGGVLDLRSCTLLQTLNAYNTQLTGVNIDGLTRLVKFDVDDNPNLVGEIDLSSNTGLQVARARNTKITGFNINGLKNLTSVDVSLNPQLVGEFDFTSNTALNYLNLNRIGITSVNIQGLRNLTVFAIQDTPIPNLDVSTNTSLEQLNAATNLTWLNVGDNPNLSFFATRNSVIDLGEIGDSFNIATVTEAFKGIDISKVTMVSGATYDPTTGEVSGYQNGTPIVYNYDSGTMENGEAVSITVTLNFTKPLTASEININSYEGKRYDGTAVSNPTDITKTGSSGVVTFEWFRKTADGNWESLGNLAPVNAGEYGVKAHLAADLHYAAADSGEPTPFTITQASSSIRINSYEDKEWDGNPVSDPSNITRTENSAEVIFKYYRADDMTTEIAAPSEVGEYVVKAVLSGDANYTDSESNLVHFRIVGLRTEITLTYRDHIYTGNPVADPQKDVHYTVQGSTGAVSVEWYNANDLTTPLEQAPVNVGSYVVKVSVAGTTSHVGASATASFQITQASSTISINNYVGKKYDKNPVSDPTNITTTGSDGAVTFEWFRKTADGNWESLGEEAPVNVGEYGVKALLAANQNYAGANSGEPTPFTITQAPSIIHINSYDGKVYDGNPVSNPTNITRTDNNAAVTFKYYHADDTTTEIPAPSEVGAYKVKAFLSGDANYIDSESSFVDFNIASLGTTITLTYKDKVYTGNPVEEPQKDVHYTIEGSTGAVTIEWYEASDLTTPLTQAPVNVGNYVVKVSVAGTDTHAGASKYVAFQITQASSEISINHYDGKPYDGTAVSNPTDVVTKGSDGAVTFEWFAKSENGDWVSLGDQAPVNAGNYGVKAHLAANQNYAGADSGEPTPFEITQATSSIRINSYDG
ncbi:MAG: MBG domain-containing protein, partial [Erysipelotrichaceae bacterium]|nr:MBG domain-containing protein [Erysipelotrichaceae bacterium]